MTSPDQALVATTRRLEPGESVDAGSPGDSADPQWASLLARLPDADPVAWLHRGDGIVGWGRVASIRAHGPTRFTEASKWWTETVARCTVDDPVDEPGSGLVCFGSFAFADGTPPEGSAESTGAGESVLVVPEFVLGRRGGTSWLTTIRPADSPPAEPELTGPAPEDVAEVVFSDGAVDGEHWMGVVADAVARIERGELEKVVLARELVATATAPVDVRTPLTRLAAAYPMCWVFHVDGLFGATPEMLVRRERGLVTSRVLAGTIRPTGNDERDLALAAALARSSKDLEEHEYAVRSVADALDPHCSSMNVPESPSVLHLPNVMHLATDVAGVARDDTTSLELAAALHPSAAVGGTPTPDAVALIAEIEGMDRGRYAGPVGWMDASGDGEWGIALRSGQLGPDRRTIRLFAGCGIVASSDPASELAESQAKLVPMRDALSAR